MRSIFAIGAKVRPTMTRYSVARFTVDNKHDAKDHARVHSMGSQAEAEWKGTTRGVHYVFNDTGYDVPDVYKEHREKFSTAP